MSDNLGAGRGPQPPAALTAALPGAEQPSTRGRKRPALRFLLAALLAFVVAGVTLGAAGAVALHRLPDANLLRLQPLPSDTLVYDRTGTVLLADLHPPGYVHYDASLSDMGRYLPAATVAVEDANFWTEPGIDPLGMARAGWADVRAGSIVQGGSTITQQLVKRRLVGSDQSISRKIREAAVAVRVSSTFSRREILGMYLNSIFYGNTAYGAAAAAHVYFHTDAAHLSLAQAALLAGLPQDPTLLDPLTHWPAAKERQRQVLDAMVRVHAISRPEADRAFADDISPPLHLYSPTSANPVPGFVDLVQRQLPDLVGDDAMRRGGLTVVTTLDWGLQQRAQQAITEGVRANQWRNVSDGALVALDPRSGEVLALVGSAGPDVPGGQYNMAVWPPRNPGSSFKVFTYAAAIDSRRYTMVTPIPDAPLRVQMPGTETYVPRNYDLRYHGTCQLQACLGNSLNVPAVEVELGTGISAVVDEARRLGAPPYQEHGGRYTTTDPAASFGPPLTLGGYGETPLQMATGVSVLANRGVLNQPRSVRSVTVPGRSTIHPDGSGRQVLDAGTAFIVSQMLSDDANREMVFGRDTPLTVDGYHVAAKTGTSDDFSDAWTVGYTPSIAVAVWMGNADFHPMVQGSDGMFVAAPAWHDFMAAALGELQQDDRWYDQPGDVETRWVGGRPAYFLPGTGPFTASPSLPSWAHLDGWSGAGDDRGARSGAGCRTWTFNGRSYWACVSGDSGLPGDPGG